MLDQQVSAADVDPEVVRGSLRDFVQQLASAERERVSTLLLSNHHTLCTSRTSITRNSNIHKIVLLTSDKITS